MAFRCIGAHTSSIKALGHFRFLQIPSVRVACENEIVSNHFLCAACCQFGQFVYLFMEAGGDGGWLFCQSLQLSMESDKSKPVIIGPYMIL